MHLFTPVAILTAFLTPLAISLDLSPVSRPDARHSVRAFVTSFDDPDDSRLKFRVIRTCDRRTGLGSLCHYVVRFKNGEAKEFSDPVCIPIACPRRSVTPSEGEDQLVLSEQGDMGSATYSQNRHTRTLRRVGGDEMRE